jgi:choline dehydrogenase-like flavoprotein
MTADPGKVAGVPQETTSPGRVIVIGSGPPGATAALFLQRAGADVLVLEAGSERAARGICLRVAGFTILRGRRPLRQRPFFLSTADPKAKLYEDVAPGGLSNHWSCAVPRFSSEDFADGERGGTATTWPIGYDDLAPWYDRVEPLLRIAGSAAEYPQLPAGRVASEKRLGAGWAPIVAESSGVGRTLAPMPYAFGAATTVTLSGTAFNSFVRLVRPEQKAGRLAVRFGARVLRLEWAAAQRRVEAVVVRDEETGSEERLACRGVVVAAGAIGTPEILLNSMSADFPQGLGNTDGVLGRYFHDHPLGKLVIDLSEPVAVHPASYLTRPTLDRSPPLYAAACMQWSGVEVLARSVLQRTPGSLPWLGFSVFGTMEPTPENWVGVDPKRRGPDGAPGLDLHMSYPAAARLALDQAKDDLTAILARAGLKPRVRLWNVEPVGESKHFGGTCRMHASSRYGMLDRWSRMHAVRNVVVADSSAFTTGAEKNPVLTAMALAARASERLAADIRQGDL